TLLAQLANYGWSFGGRMDYCLNYDDNLSTSLLANDIHDFTVQSTLNVGDYYTINFDVNPDGTIYGDTVESNQSAIVKQGKALQSAIKHVLDKTGAGKVILVGHSMGGLAAREYLQNSSDWQTDGTHHVAKLLTIGTPHGGSDEWTFGGINGTDGYSDAVRDLRWSYSNGNAGVYLFGGNENYLTSLGFHNLDVNCNGFVGDSIVGLNQKNIPSDLAYTCIIGTGGLTGDGLVNATRANLNNYYHVNADTFLVDAVHWNLTTEVSTIIKGLDEPTYFTQAYSIGLDSLCYGLITMQSLGNSFTDDYDDYKVHIGSNGSLQISVGNIEVSRLSAAIFDSSYTRKIIAFNGALSRIDTVVSLSSGNYYFEIEAQPDQNGWKFPYSFELRFTPTTDVHNDISGSVTDFELGQNFPNPFNPSTTITFSLPSRQFVSLKIYDVLGREVASLVSSTLSAGKHSVQWNALNNPSGVYFYTLQAGTHRESKKLLLMK
ncbi:MAG: alpha/beta fold hydrolase, partial [Desulfomonilaceae bacterium]